MLKHHMLKYLYFVKLNPYLKKYNVYMVIKNQRRMFQCQIWEILTRL